MKTNQGYNLPLIDPYASLEQLSSLLPALKGSRYKSEHAKLLIFLLEGVIGIPAISHFTAIYW